jgi:hypothetical protein
MTTKPRLVVIESPYGTDDPIVLERNVGYAKSAMKDSLRRGEAPLASHLLYTQVLDDTVPEERTQGIEAGLTWALAAEASVVYCDYGWSPGMTAGIARAREAGRTIEERTILYAFKKDDKVTELEIPDVWWTVLEVTKQGQVCLAGPREMRNPVICWPWDIAPYKETDAD